MKYQIREQSIKGSTQVKVNLRGEISEKTYWVKGQIAVWYKHGSISTA
jgi:hypothetical protein